MKAKASEPDADLWRNQSRQDEISAAMSQVNQVRVRAGYVRDVNM